MSKTLAIVVAVFLVQSIHAQTYFVDVASSVGVVHTFGNGLYGGGISFYDFNGDGWDDLTLASEEGDSLYFFVNNFGMFTRIQPTWTDNTFEAKQILWVDHDNDGDKDLFVAGNHWELSSIPNRSKLYNNDGNFNFTDVTVTAGLPLDTLPNYGANFGDYNNDGWLDLLLLNRTVDNTHYMNYLYQNNGDGTYTDVTLDAGVVYDSTMTFCAAFLDHNNDGWQDIYMAQDLEFGNPLYKNNGDGSYTEIGGSSGATVAIDAMCVAVGDYDNNGFQDIYCTNTWPGNKLLRNIDGDNFVEEADQMGVGFNSVAWGANFVDLDCDTDLDLYVSGTWPSEPSTQSVCYENLNAGQEFVIANWGFDGDTTASYSNAIGDFNNDGYPDIAVNNSAPSEFALWESTGNTNHWLKVKLQGTIGNSDGIGSFIEAYIDGNKYIRYTHCGIGYLAQNSSYEFFGTGSSTFIDSLKVRWLSGIVDVEYNLSADQSITLVEGSGLLPTNVADKNGTIEVRIFPQPASNILNIYWNYAEVKQLTLFDGTGKNIDLPFRIHGNSASCDVRELPLGIYFLSIETRKDRTTTYKVIKGVTN